MIRKKFPFVALALALALWAAPVLAQEWNAAADWNGENPNGAWSYLIGWVAAENPANSFDAAEHPGLERWGRFDSPDDLKPYIGKNVSDEPVEVHGLVVSPGALVMDTLPNPLGPGVTPILRWTAPEAGSYEIEIRIRNLSDGQADGSVKPDGVEWLVYYSGFNIAHSFNLDAGKEDSFTRTTYLDKGMWYAVAFNARANNFEDLSEISFIVRRK